MIIQRIVFNLIFIVYQNQILKDNLLGGRHEVRQPLYNWEAFTIVYYRETEIYVRELVSTNRFFSFGVIGETLANSKLFTRMRDLRSNSN